MMRTAPRTLTAIAALGLTAAPALADITPDDAWDIWLAQFRALGLTVDADVKRGTDTLDTGQLTLHAELPMDVGSISVSLLNSSPTSKVSNLTPVLDST